jgi:hypothetical protein
VVAYQLCMGSVLSVIFRECADVLYYRLSHYCTRFPVALHERHGQPPYVLCLTLKITL